MSRLVLRLRYSLICSSESYSVLPDSSPITAPSLLHKPTRSKGPFLRRRYPASSVLWPSPTPGLAAALADDVGGATLHQPRASPTRCRSPSPHAVLITPVDRCRCSLVVQLRDPARVSSLPVLPSPFLRRVGVHIFTFEACSSFTRVTACKVAHPPFVGFIARLRPNRFPGSDARKLPSSTNNLLGWVLPPLVICPVGAH